MCDCWGRGGGGGGGGCTCKITGSNGVLAQEVSPGTFTITANIPELVSPRTPNALEVDSTGKLRVIPGAVDCAQVVACVTGTASLFGCGLAADDTAKTISVKTEPGAGLECTASGLRVHITDLVSSDSPNALTTGSDGRLRVVSSAVDCAQVVACVTGTASLFGCGLVADDTAKTISVKTEPGAGLECTTDGLRVRIADLVSADTPNAISTGSDGKLRVVSAAVDCAQVVACVTGTESMIGCGLVADSAAKTLGVKADPDGGIECTGNGIRLKKDPVAGNILQVTSSGVSVVIPALDCEAVVTCMAGRLDNSLQVTGSGSSRVFGLKRDPAADNALTVGSAGVKVVVPPAPTPASFISADTPNTLVVGTDGKLKVPAGALDCNAVMDCVATHLATSNAGLQVVDRTLSVKRDPDSGNILTVSDEGLGVVCRDVMNCVGANIGNGLDYANGKILFKRDPAADNALTMGSAGVKVVLPPAPTPTSFISADTPNILTTGSDGKLKVPPASVDCTQVVSCVTSTPGLFGCGLDVDSAAKTISVKDDPAGGLECGTGGLKIKIDPASAGSVTTSAAGLKVVSPAPDCQAVLSCIFSNPDMFGCGFAVDAPSKKINTQLDPTGGLDCTNAGLKVKINTTVPNIIHSDANGIYAGCSDVMFCVRTNLDATGGLGPSGAEGIKILLDPAAGNLLKTTSAGASVSCTDVVTCVSGSLGNGLNASGGKIQVLPDPAAGNLLKATATGTAVSCTDVVNCVGTNLGNGLEAQSGKIQAKADPVAGNLLKNTATGLAVSCTDVVTCVSGSLGNGLNASGGKIQVLPDPAAGNLLKATATGTAVSCTDVVNCVGTNLGPGLSYTGGKIQAATPTVRTLADAPTIAIDASQGNYFRVTLGGNRTLGIPTNPTDGQKIIIEVTQDGTGNRTLTPTTTGAGCWALGTDITALTLSTAAGKIDMIGAVYCAPAAAGAGRWLITSLVRGF